MTLGYALRDLGDYAGAAGAFEFGLGADGADESSLEACTALLGLASVRIAQGQHADAEALLNRAVELLEATGQLQGLARAWLSLSVLSMARGDLDKAGRLAQEAREIRERFNHPKETAPCCNQQGEVFRLQGRLDEAEEAYMRALALFESIGSPWTFMPRVNLALVRMEQNRLGLAREGLEAAWVEVRSAGRAVIAEHIDTLLLPCYAAEGNWIAFDERMARAAHFEEGKSLVDNDSVRCLETAADFARARGERERAEATDALAGRHRDAMGGT